MLFKDFAHYLEKLEKTSSRLTMTEVLAELLKELTVEEIEPASYLLQGSLVPTYQSLEFQMSGKMLLRTLARLVATHSQTSESQDLFGGLDLVQVQADLEKRFKKLGDIGELFIGVMEEKLNGDQDEGLSLNEVYLDLKKIAKASGQGSQEEKVQLLLSLLEKLDSLSAKFISRIVLGKMRLGFSTMTMLDALSWTKRGDKSAAKELERAFQKKADFGLLAKAYLFDNSINFKDLLDSYQMELGIPVVPALCQRLNSAQEIIEKMGVVIAEPKYDGLRIQIHINQAGFEGGKKYKAFTRNLDDVSHMFPELGELASQIDCETAVFDSEAIGFDPKTGEFKSFQETIQRKRKHNIASKALEVPICFYIFDLLYLNDQRLIDEELMVRKKLLANLLPDSKLAKKTTFIETGDPDELRKFHEAELAAGLEGAVMKKPSSPYVAGRKGWRWVKIKEAEGSRGKLNDTLDCVMMGYYLGKGKRQSFGIGALLVGVRDEDTGEIKSISKIGTGFTDAQFHEIKGLADQHLTRDNKKPEEYLLPKDLKPDVYLEPSIVLEIAADEISKSPTHKAGVALRFPRLVQIRHDKNVEMATTLSEVKAIHIA